MMPICNRPKYMDGHCVLLGGDWHISDSKMIKRYRVPAYITKGAYTYAGNAMKRTGRYMTLTDTPTGFGKWSSTMDRDKETLCVFPTQKSRQSFKYGIYHFERVSMAGRAMTSDNIYNACREKMLRPVCDSANVADGRCRIAGAAWRYSNPKQSTEAGIPLSKTKGAYFYNGAGKPATMNNGYAAKTADPKWDMDGDTFCVKRSLSFVSKFELFGWALHRVPVKGTMNNRNIAAACEGAGMRPVCDSHKWYDGKCQKVGLDETAHWSDPSYTENFPTCLLYTSPSPRDS